MCWLAGHLLATLLFPSHFNLGLVSLFELLDVQFALSFCITGEFIDFVPELGGCPANCIL